jgi:hypothetical protein
MSFAVFRKYQKPLLWAVVIFSVLIFATFSGFGDIKAVLTRQDLGQLYGRFDVQASGQPREVGLDEFAAARQHLNRFRWAQGAREGVEDQEAWAHIICKAEAEASGMQVSDRDVSDLVRRMLGGQAPTREAYEGFWRDRLQFASAREMEEFLREVLLGWRWMEFQGEAAGVVGADEIYLRWRTDNEVFDYEAVVVADLADGAVPEPAPEELQAWWDGLAQPVREAKYQDPRRIDLLYAWAPLAAGESAFPDDRLASLAELDEAQVTARFGLVGHERWPDATEATPEMRAELARELKVAAAAQAARAAFESGEDKSPEAFRTQMEAAGFRVEDPEGLLGSDEIKALPEVGSDMLAAWLAQTTVGSLHLDYPYGTQDHVGLVLVTAEQASRPLAFEEAHEALVRDWKASRKDKPARDWREALRAAARALPECVAVLQPLLDDAAKRAEQAVAALPADATDDQRAAARQQVLDAAERTDVAPRVAEFERLVWDSVPRPEGAQVQSFTGVPRSYARNPTGTEEAGSIERLLRTAPAIFRLAVDSVSDVIRHAASSHLAVVRITGRRFPEQPAMLADQAGMELARKELSRQRRMEAQLGLSPGMLIASRKLEVSQLEQKARDVPEVPPDA